MTGMATRDRAFIIECLATAAGSLIDPLLFLFLMWKPCADFGVNSKGGSPHLFL